MKTEVPGRNRTGHGGTIHAVLKQRGQSHGQVIDFSANINPLGPPEWLRPLISRELDSVLHYPDPEYPELIEAISTFYKVDPGCVIPSNGSTDLLYLLPRILECKRALVPVPSYIDYVKAVQLAGLDVEEFLLREEDDFKLDLVRLSSEICPGDLVIFASPNNPTGAYIESSAICRLAMDFPEATFLIDEAFLDFVQTGECIGARLPNLLTLNSMTKFYGVPGLRLGFGVFPHEIAEQVRESLPPWTLNSLAQAFGVECLRDFEYHQRSRDEVVHLRQLLVTHLENFDQLKVFPSKGNYLMIKLENGLTSPVLAAQLLEHGILIRCCDNYSGLDDRYFRIAVRTEVENYQLLEALTTVLDSGHKKYPQRTRKTPAIMFQGTSSNAGKSVLTAALCRILLQDGVRVAPFKAQNMSLNSFVTRNGEEMGRAQVVQAQAAKLDPDVRMNPILLKPNSDTGSQIIVNGFPVGNMSVLDYGRYKPKAWEAVCKSYDSLSDEYDAVVLEGAGSPGEVNLKAEDIVNMRMAAYAEAPVLLVGDIDRGGVYASYVGTMEVLSAWERELVAGFVINRFRGQASLLDSAHKYLVDHTGRHSFGVVPYLSDLGLPEEDSVSFKAGLFNRKAKSEEFIDIALINFPHISNFTDVEPFLAEPDVSLRVVDSVEALGNPDVIILPGSKNVIGDLRFLEQKGFSQLLKALGTQKKCEIVGICGGYQVLGKRIDDPHGIESNSKTIEAIGLLDITTELKEKKTLTRQEGTHIESGATVFGYEIHHGISESVLAPVLRFNDGRSCGSMIETGRVWGSYLHGIFDSDSFRRWFIDSIRERKGLQPVKQIMAPYDLESAFDRLADTVRSSLDMDRIYSLLKL